MSLGSLIAPVSNTRIALAEFFNVTLPNLRGEIIVALIFTVTLALRNFDLIYINFSCL